MQESNKIRTIIIEDILIVQEYLTSLLKKHFPEVTVVGYSNSIKKSIPLIKSERPEIIFMDIELEDGLSFEIFDHLKHQDFEVIFVTSFSHFLQKALDHYAFNFITKPIDEHKFIAVVQHYINLRERLYTQNKHKLLMEFLDVKKSKLLLHVGNEYISVNIADILKCEANGNYTVFHLSDTNKYLVSKPLNYFENLLLPKGFFKAHRSTIVNINCIKSIYKKETIILSNNDKVHISVRNKSNLADLILKLS